MSEAIHCVRGPVVVFGIPLPHSSDTWKHYQDTKFPLPPNLERSELLRYEIGQASQVETHLTEICEHIFPDVRIQIGFRHSRSERDLLLALIAATCESDALKPKDEDIREVVEKEGFSGGGEPGWYKMAKSVHVSHQESWPWLAKSYMVRFQTQLKPSMDRVLEYIS